MRVGWKLEKRSEILWSEPMISGISLGVFIEVAKYLFNLRSTEQGNAVISVRCSEKSWGEGGWMGLVNHPASRP